MADTDAAREAHDRFIQNELQSHDERLAVRQSQLVNLRDATNSELIEVEVAREAIKRALHFIEEANAPNALLEKADSYPGFLHTEPSR
jgi:hypothetical protein